MYGKQNSERLAFITFTDGSGGIYEPNLNARHSKVQEESKVRTWFNEVARETLAGDNTSVSDLSIISQQQSSAAVSVTVEPFEKYNQIYQVTNLIRKTGYDGSQSIRNNGDDNKEIEQMELQTEALKRKVQNVQQKEEIKA